jgi:hypothetical protein
MERGGLIIGCNYDIHMDDMHRYVHSNTAHARLPTVVPTRRTVAVESVNSGRSGVVEEVAMVHVVVLQHGFQGCSHDMKHLRNAITVEFPNFLVRRMISCGLA